MISVEAYNPQWAVAFEALKNCLHQQLGDAILGIEHVGSTAVPGLKAKPILDIDIVIEANAEKRVYVIAQLAKLGYQHRGDLGIKGREAFKRLSAKVPLDGSARDWQTHHLYVCQKGNPGLENHLRLRDYLRAHPEAASAYGALKEQLAQDHPTDIDAYIEGKTAFIVEILRKTGMDQKLTDAIVEQNRAD